MKENKVEFIRCVEEAINSSECFTEMALEFFEDFKKAATPAQKITEKGAKILKFMQEKKESGVDSLTAKEIAEGIDIPSRSIAGCMKKLISDGYCDKEGKDPVIYRITEMGMNEELDF